MTYFFFRLLNSKDFSRFNRAALSSSNVKAKPNAFPPIQQLPTVNNPWFKYTSSFGTFAARTWKIEPVLGPNPIYGIQVPTVNKPQFK